MSYKNKVVVPPDESILEELQTGDGSEHRSQPVKRMEAILKSKDNKDKRETH